MPPNVTLTGFLSDEAYGGLVCGADVVMTLTTRDHTMLRGAYEAIYQGTPVIVSDWPLLREALRRGRRARGQLGRRRSRPRSGAWPPRPIALREGARRLRERKLRAVGADAARRSSRGSAPGRSRWPLGS